MRDLRLYNSISSTYVSTRRADSRVAAWIHNALGDAERVVNVGAGTGNYEPDNRRVVAVEPSAEMIAKRPSTAALAIRAAAEEMPLKSAAFDVALAILTVHHWRDRNRGLAEMCRVAPKQVIFLFDPVKTYRFWAIDYWPEALSLPSERDAVGPNDVAALLDVVNVQTVPIPIDCTDGFGAAFWDLDPQILNRPGIPGGSMPWK